MKSKSCTIYFGRFYGIFMFIVGKIFIQLILVRFLLLLAGYVPDSTANSPDSESMLHRDSYLMIRMSILLKLDFLCDGIKIK